MSIKPVERPLDGERVIALSPETANEAATDWLRRPNLFPGRALTTATLEQRQRWQAGRIAVRGQAFTRGVAGGLEVDCTLESVTGTEPVVRLRIAPGRALTFSGEDVVVPTPIDVRLLDLPVVAEPRVFAQARGETLDDGGTPGSGLGVLRPRAIGALRLGELLAVERSILPPAGVLVLQPIVADRSDFDPTDPCDRCQCAEATEAAPDSFEDWRTADGVRLLWYAWPDEWRTLPPATPRRRNALAHIIFDAEAALGHGEPLPWEPWGAPVALLGMTDEWHPAFADRAAVVRRGGRARHARLTLASGGRVAADSRLPGLWQARIEQLAEQIAEMGSPLPDAAGLAQAFSRLPPCGLLPINVINLDALPLNLTSEVLRTRFFPPGFELDAVPVPLPQLDVAIRDAAPLATIDLSAAERVRVLVPVTQASYEPRLLYEEVVAPEFQQTVERFELVRARALGARRGLQEIVQILNEAITGALLPHPDLAGDPLALEPESLSPWGPPPAGGGHRTPVVASVHHYGFTGASVTVTAAADELLYAWVYLDADNPPRTLMLQWEAPGRTEPNRAYWGPNLIGLGTDGTPSRLQIDAEPPAPGRWHLLTIDPALVGLAGVAISGMTFTLYDGRAAFGPTGVIRGGHETVWFSNILPPGARPAAEHEWEFLSDEELWAPFEPDLGVAPPSGAHVPPGGGHIEPAAPGQHQHLFINATTPFAVAAGNRMFVWAWLDPKDPPRELMVAWMTGTGNASRQHRAIFGEDLIATLPTPGNVATSSRSPLPALGTWVKLIVPALQIGLEGEGATGMAFALVDGGATFGATGRIAADGSEVTWFSGSLPPGAATVGTWNFLTPVQMASPLGDTTVVTALAELRANPALAPLSVRERAQLDVRGVQGFITYLKSRTDRADDLVDYGFIKVQTDVYRVRQLVLGTTAATRLAVSPALASIAQAETAVASQEQISTFFDKLVSETPPSAPAPTDMRGSGGTGGSVPPAFEVGGTRSARSAADIAAADPTLTAGSRIGIAAARATVGGPRIAAGAPLTPVGGLGAGIDLEVNIGRRPATEVFRPPAVGATFEIQEAAAIVRGATRDSGVIGAKATVPAPTDVVNAPPIVGKANIRTTAIAQRLQDPKSIEAKDYAAATRHEAVAALVRLAAQLRAEDGNVTPGLFEGIDVYGVRDDPFLGADNTLRRVPLTTFVFDHARLDQLLTTPVRTKPVPSAPDSVPDEGAYFSDSADLSDNTVALMRQLEGRIRLYRDAIAAAERTLARLRDGITLGSARLAATADTLAEARHDVSVAKALLAEETGRITGINRRRADVLAKEVRFLAFVRPREADNLASAPRRQLDPGLIDAPAPACLGEHADVPDELTDMLRVVRDAPAAWFVDVPRLLDRLDRPDLLVKALRSTQLRAQLTTPAAAVAAPVNRLVGAMASMKARQLQVVTQARSPAIQLDLARVQSLTWQGARDQAAQVVSLGDLIDGEHGRGEVARRAAQTFDEIERIAACLHAEFSDVVPSIRLDWAETLSQFDESPGLRRLGTLARWGEIPYVDRYRLQSFTDWLFSRINAAEPRAESLMNDVVRMCLLLASHAPVGRIIAGRLPRPVTVRPGVRLPLTAFDISKLRVGMEALVYRNASVVARAVVEDIGASEIATRVIHTAQPQIDLDVDVRVQFGAAAALRRTAASRPMALLR